MDNMNELFILLAQEAAKDANSGNIWGPTLVQAGIAGVVLWYVGSSLIPRLLDANDRAIAAFKEEAKLEREAHSRALDLQRTHCDGKMEEIRRLVSEK